MSALYREIAVGGTAYPTGPQMTTVPLSASGPSLNAALAWTPEFHTYRIVAGVSGGDVFFSFDGVNDHGRIPFGPDSVGGLVLPLSLPVYYKQAWLRAAVGGATAVVGAGFYTKQ